MKKTFNYYFVPTLLFILLTSLHFPNQEPQSILMGILGSTFLGVMVGLIIHLTAIIKRKIT
ncbi:hypothetical protein [Halalkalibacter hemicellulosilyticus]|uniref:Uncharacterized protein n=1 Tax=Halalkalibacter hemicellulosilyticusJCM 9152 TaxID=1236971 RepID=W4QDP7_9BACI|nr:hypothetical protein [Halalkalibacter hemicellulosilyticus]GAE30067.1 hypothetical protein JCM9152_1463 [Halalkalibacter hemicellulosilyticusJCM 9152]